MGFKAYVRTNQRKPQIANAPVEKHFHERSAEQQVPPLRSPGFPVECSGADEVRAALFTESRIRGRCWLCEVGNPGTLRSG
jgi:hypothetical protein